MQTSRMAQIEQQALKRYLEFDKAKKNAEANGGAASRMMSRSSIINMHDNLAMERIINHSDLFPIAYLQVGLNVSKAVCRLTTRNRSGQIESYGTGFLVAPSLLLTNHHVLHTYEAAQYAAAEFNYEDDVNFLPKEIVSFRLDPDKLFITDEELDFTLVAVHDIDAEGVKLSDFGYLPLLPQPGKILEGEYVSIIQHPKGGPKAVTIRENEVKFISSDYVHYVSDTEPGSSGSPVFNDQWVVVALHHAGIPHPEDDSKWIANEGIRISSIVRHLTQHQASAVDANGRQLLDQLLLDPAAVAAPMEIGTLEAQWYSGAAGYDPAFLGQGFEIPLPILNDERQSDIAETADGKKVLDYTHFSIVMSKSRKLAYYSAVNIDGSQLIEVKRENDKWYFDPRIPEEYQTGPEVYKNNDIDRGHLTRRQDPNWGMDAVKANEHTFHFTNCSPQHKNFNQKIWLSLEDYLLENAGEHDLKVTVFTGPVFRASDVVYRGCQIPVEFWKVAVMKKEDGSLSVTAYLQSQENLIGDLEFVYGGFQTYQVAVAEIEQLTGLDFGELRNYDALAASTVRVVIASREDLQL
ncbi:DNA/RNA non-specific endonuclease [Planococcus shenhongbingii]|uniref:Serine protease n=1 Tax=Planococcus shenhongbingii TaxID=3058398 RepID=A0ABT8N9Q6_9BACL|nr:DNA/RNA non-specific endonuclease [Planococcus sp. N017]MDN7244608.1 DNA/RNA non-specific endonuclease [Planococcus sp. N017]